MRMTFLRKICCLATAALLAPEAARASDCIASYRTELRVGTQEQLDHLLGLLDDLPSDLSAHLAVQIDDSFLRAFSAQPFAAARFSDLIYTLEFLNKAMGAEFTPQMHAAVVTQFTSPVTMHQMMAPLEKALLNAPERFSDLIDRHVGAHRFWERYGLCASNSPYWFYRKVMETALLDVDAATIHDARRFIRSRNASIPMRKLADENLIVRRTYQPHDTAPRVEYHLPPCSDQLGPRRVAYRYDAAARTWAETAPVYDYHETPNLGFSDWSEIDSSHKSRFNHSTNPEQYALRQAQLAVLFQDAQRELGLPVKLPKVDLLRCN
ncbi:hypothetical protein [Leisingera sp. ANG-Vp]|uniref:hypothetical protein n=1 Tax=Leisingera sp. ANG-Vp TaxID=1577896 RepID=UPI00126A41B1|nr:hypothetical protein [Leisingera sp. ANG-Vp]